MKKDYWTIYFRASHSYYRPPMYGISRTVRAGIDDLALVYVEKREIRHKTFIYQKCGDRGNVYSIKGISPTLQAVMGTGGHHVPCIAVRVHQGKKTAL